MLGAGSILAGAFIGAGIGALSTTAMKEGEEISTGNVRSAGERLAYAVFDDSMSWDEKWAYAFEPGQMVADFVTGVVIGEILDGIMAAIQNKLRSIFANYDAAMREAFESGSNTTRRQAFREAKEAAGIPKSAEYKTHKFVFDGTSENRIVYEFDVCGEKKYIIEHPFDKMGRGNHFHGADDTKGSPFSKGRYNQYPGHFPEDFNGFN